MFIMCGPCNLCDACNMPEGKPCVQEQNRFSCLSAYCIDAAKMAKHCNMDMQWNGDVVSFLVCISLIKNKSCRYFRDTVYRDC